MKTLKADSLAHLSKHHGRLLNFWIEGHERPDVSIENHCDMVYSLFLLGELQNISGAAVDSFCGHVQTVALPGWDAQNDLGPSLSVHNCAYLFGAMNLLGLYFHNLYARVLAGRTFNLAAIADADTLTPKFSAKWAHHSWRVSHWLGGVPSILLSLESSHSDSLPSSASAAACRTAVDKLIDPGTGLIRAYKSTILQKLFRAAYGLRHSPDLGDMGGIAHILWIDHAMGKRYVAVDSIREESSRLLQKNKPFMENVPYCLDFDVIQALRTSIQQTGTPATASEIKRSSDLMISIEEFFKCTPDHFSLHKVPGALATHHECSLLLGHAHSPSSNGPPLDVILAAKWL